MEEQQKPDLGREDLGEKVMSDIKSDFKVVGSSRVKNWYLWLALAIIIGVAGGIAYVANRSGEFQDSDAAQNKKVEGVRIIGSLSTSTMYLEGAKLFAMQWNAMDDKEKDESGNELYKEFPRLSNQYAKIIDGVYQSEYDTIGGWIQGGNGKDHVVLGKNGKRGGVFLLAPTVGSNGRPEQRVNIWYSDKLSGGVYPINIQRAPDIDGAKKVDLKFTFDVRDLKKNEVDGEKIDVLSVRVLSAFAGYPYSGDIPFSREYGQYVKRGTGTGDNSAVTLLPDSNGEYILKGALQNEPVFVLVKLKARSGGAGLVTVNERVQLIVPTLPSGKSSATASIKIRLSEKDGSDKLQTRPVTTISYN